MMKKQEILLFLLEKYVDWEAAYLSTAVYSMSRDNYEIKTVSLSKELLYSAGGLCVVPDYDLESMPEDYAALILVGGYTWRTGNVAVLRPVVERCISQNRLLGAICDATVYLASIGKLNHVKHTSNDLAGLMDYAGEAYCGSGNYIVRNVVGDQSIITSNGAAPVEFAREVLLWLQAAPPAKIDQWFLFHRLGYYAVPEAQY